jgi:hypothetical protein
VFWYDGAMAKRMTARQLLRHGVASSDNELVALVLLTAALDFMALEAERAERPLAAEELYGALARAIARPAQLAPVRA